MCVCLILVQSLGPAAPCSSSIASIAENTARKMYKCALYVHHAYLTKAIGSSGNTKRSCSGSTAAAAIPRMCIPPHQAREPHGLYWCVRRCTHTCCKSAMCKHASVCPCMNYTPCTCRFQCINSHPTMCAASYTTSQADRRLHSPVPGRVPLWLTSGNATHHVEQQDCGSRRTQQSVVVNDRRTMHTVDTTSEHLQWLGHTHA